MKIAVPKEYYAGETRVPLIPGDVKALVEKGATVEIESGMGDPVGYHDSDYTAAGANVASERNALISSGDIILRIRKSPLEEIKWLRQGALHISYFDPFAEKELLDAFVSMGISAVSMEMIPRTTRAQSMDVLSSQASLAGYAAVILAAERLPKILPMMMTPSGTLAPAKVFVIGAGVAGLQSIATARRLGARVEAFDTRPVVEEEVRSLGAKFIKIDLGETGQTADGYAKALTDQQLDIQRQAMTEHCAAADIVITTAQVFGKKAPLILTKEMVAAMKGGSVVVDLAVEGGGNVEGVVPGEETTVQGVRIIGFENMSGRVPVHASQMYSRNLLNFILEYWDDDKKVMELNLDDEIIQRCLVTHNHEIFSRTLKEEVHHGS
ncbi:MAG: NAD(P) transhydrogenase subunit alpha [Deltaproteobacteria bacterium]|nr:NAD(P) transhydrogenase subunit alpha [Deltaproteobacteria bacterium]